MCVLFSASDFDWDTKERTRRCVLISTIKEEKELLDKVLIAFFSQDRRFHIYSHTFILFTPFHLSESDRDHNQIDVLNILMYRLAIYLCGGACCFFGN